MDTVEKNEIAIKKYIKNSLKDDIMLGQLTLDKIVQLLMVAGNNMQMASSNSNFKRCKNYCFLGDREKPPVFTGEYLYKNEKNVEICQIV